MEWFDMILNNNLEATARNRQFVEWLQAVEIEIEKLGFEAFINIDLPKGEIYTLRNGAQVFIPELSEKFFTLAHVHMDFWKVPIKAAKNIVFNLKNK